MQKVYRDKKGRFTKCNEDSIGKMSPFQKKQSNWIERCNKKRQW